MTRPVCMVDLENVDGEVLPRRTVLSVVTVNNGPGAGAVAPAPAASAPAGGGAEFMSTCTTTTSPGTPGLLGSLGLGSSQPYTSVTCVPTSGSSR